MRILNAKFGWRRNLPHGLELTAEHRRRLRERFAQYRTRLKWRAFLLAIPFVVAFAVWEFVLEVPLLGRPMPGWLSAIKIIAFIAFAQAAIAYMLRARHARVVRTILRELGHDVCVTCGYVLRGLGAHVQQCPECGAKRETMYGESDAE